MLNKRRALDGFAIVEVLVATVVIAIGFLELARAFRNINGVAVQAVAMTKASNLAHATMERIRARRLFSIDISRWGHNINGPFTIVDGNGF
jgi:Tfp pilus assembly protein PilV